MQSAGGLDAAAASLRADVDQLDVLLRSLVDKLRAIPGLSPAVTYRRSRLRRILGDLPYVNDLYRRSSPIERISVTVADRAFELGATTSSITCSIESRAPSAARSVTVVSFSEWIKELMATIDERNRLAADSMAALQHLIVFDQVD